MNKEGYCTDDFFKKRRIRVKKQNEEIKWSEKYNNIGQW